MVDRLGELGLGRIPSSFDRPEQDSAPLIQDEIQEVARAEPAEQAHLNSFYSEVGVVKQKMSQMRKNTKLIEDKQSKLITVVNVEQERQFSNELDELMNETNGITQEIKTILKGMQNDNEMFSKTERNTSEVRIRLNMHNTLTRKFMDLMSEYQDIQQNYKVKKRERLERQHRIVKPNATAAEIQEALDNPSNASAFEQMLTPGNKHALEEMQERQKDLEKLYKSIEELHQLFGDMALLVESQGELLDQIEHHVANAEEYSAKAVSELEKASKYKKSARKKKIVIFFCCVAIGIAVLIPLIMQNPN